jgi:hypothetical protein
VNNTTIRNCAGSGIKTTAASGGSIRLNVNNVQITKCGIGVDQVNGTIGNIHDSMISSNTTGVQTNESTAGSLVNIDSTTISNNAGTGVNVVGGSRARTLLIPRQAVLRSRKTSELDAIPCVTLNPLATADSAVARGLFIPTPCGFASHPTLHHVAL